MTQEKFMNAVRNQEKWKRIVSETQIADAT